MRHIVITNVYGYQNVGDGAILDSALDIIRSVVPEKKIHIHAAMKFSEAYNNNRYEKTFLHPYGIAIQTTKGPISQMKKITRFITVISLSLFYCYLGKLFPAMLPKSGDYAYIASLQEADMVFGIGGGYLRTKQKYTDYFGLLLTLLPIFITHVYNKRILFLPMSYGNFASAAHENIVFNQIKNDVIIFRDEISLRAFRKHASTAVETYLIPDLALFTTYTNTSTHKKNYIVVTARLWMDAAKQKKYERELALFIDYVWETYQLTTIFMPMARNHIEDDDSLVGERIINALSNKNICTISHLHTPLQVKYLLADAEAAVCTRMHAAILSTIVKTPFITIAYEHKTAGFLQHLALEKWNIDIDNFSFPIIQEKFDDLLLNNYEHFKMHLNKKHKEILQQESNLQEIIKQFAFAM